MEHMALHPVETGKYMSNAIAESFTRDMVNGDAESRSHWVIYALGTIVGTKGAGNAVKSTRVGSNVTKAAKESVKNATNKAANIQMPNLFPYGPQHQLATVGPVPYNVVDGVDLRDQMMMSAKKFAEVGKDGDRLIPGQPGIVTGGNSTTLGKNLLQDMGMKRSLKWSGYQAQHIIPSQMKNHPVIKKTGMNFDNSSNGIFFRTPADNISAMSRHRGYHSVYNKVVERALDKINMNQSVDSLQKEIYDLQNNLRKLQENGLPLYPNQGATVELWERKLSQLTE